MNNAEILNKLVTNKNLDRYIDHNLSNDVYHDPICPGISSTSLKQITRSLRHYLACKSVKVTNEAMSFGSMFHEAVLQPQLFADSYAVTPKCDKRTKEGKAIFEAFALENKNKKLISLEDFTTIQAMSESLKQIEVVNELLKQGYAEASFFWVDDETGITCKCRADWIYTDGFNTVIVDLKTTSKGVGRYSFSKTIVDHFYDLSAAFYIDGVNRCLGTDIKTIALIAIDVDAPHDVGLYCLGERTIEAGRMLYKDALRKYSHYLENPLAYLNDHISKDFQTIDINEWATDINNRRD